MSRKARRLYWTDARFNEAFGNKTTDNLNEGTTNLYHTDARVDERIGAATLGSLSDVEGTPTDGQSLVYNASDSKWRPDTVTAGTGSGTGISTISAADDTAISSPAAKNLLIYDSAVSKWENESITDVVGISNTNMNVTLGTALDGGALSITANVGTRKLGLSTITAGGATAGHVLKVGSDGNSITTGSVTGGSGGGISNISEADDTDIQSPADNETLLWDSTTNDWVNDTVQTESIASGAVTPAKTAGLTSATSGVVTVSGSTSFGTTTLPQKASAQTVAAGTDDSDFVTSLQLKNQEKSVDKGTEWSGFTYVTGSTPGTNQFTVERTNATGSQYKFNTTEARAIEMDRILGENSEFRIRVSASKQVEGEVAFGWRDGTTFGLRAKPNSTETGDIRTGTATLWANGALYPALIDQGFLTNTRLREGNNIDLTTAADGRVTISATGGSSVEFASDTEAKAGTVTDKAVPPSALHAVLEEVAHVAPYTGFQHTTSTGAAMGLGTWHINSDGTIAYYRCHNLAEQTGLFREITTDKTAQHLNTSGHLIQYDYTAAPAFHGVDGSPIGYIQVSIGSHTAIPSNPTLTGDWEISFQPSANREIMEHAPAESIPLFALATVPGGQAEGLSAQGSNSIGSLLGNVDDPTWNTITASNSNLLPIPHPAQGTTPSGTGEMTLTPRSAKSKFLLLANVGFGYLSNPKVHFLVARKIGTGNFAVVNASKKFNVLNGNYGGVDINVTPFFLDSPNTTSAVTYKWMITRGNANAVYPVGQSTALIEIPNL